MAPRSQCEDLVAERPREKLMLSGGSTHEHLHLFGLGDHPSFALPSKAIVRKLFVIQILVAFQTDSGRSEKSPQNPSENMSVMLI